MEALQQSWAGLAEISYDFSVEFSQLHSYSNICSQLIEEAVVNSIRHGKANKIQVIGKKDKDHLSIEVRDNGQFSEKSRHSGLGTILFNTFAHDWSLQRESETTVLSFTIEVSNQGSAN
jgi:anti-sigma regulatory factor (Ser/Thr protein kinase)